MPFRNQCLIVSACCVLTLGLSASPAFGQWTDIGAGLPGVDDGGVTWADFDGDGDLDVALVGDSQASGGRVSEVYLNSGGSFNLLASLSGVDGGDVDAADFDGDGDPDLVVTGAAASGPVTIIYRNDYAPGTLVPFLDIQAGLIGVGQADGRGSAARWGDYDGDGDPDLAIAGQSSAGAFAGIYENINGVFTLLSTPIVGVLQPALAWGDSDGDGDLDLIVTGDDSGGYTPRTELYRNDGGGTFTVQATVIVDVLGGAVAWGDYDCDGLLDLAISGYPGVGNVAEIYHNSGGSFSASGAGLTGVGGGALAWHDWDRDGDIDLYALGDTLPGLGLIPSPIYTNDGPAGFTALTPPWASVGAYGLGHGSSVDLGDYDQDGDLDVFIAGDCNTSDPGGEYTKIYRNDWPLGPGSVLCLTTSQPAGPGSIQISVGNGVPGHLYFTAITLTAMNATSPGSGWWSGLHIGWPELLEEIKIGAPPFLGSLNATGSATWFYPGTGQGFPIWLQSLTFYLVTRTFSPSPGYPSGSSAVVSAMFL